MSAVHRSRAEQKLAILARKFAHQLWAERKRVEAEETRRIARTLSANADRDLLLRQAAALDSEAEELEQKAAEM